MADTYVQIVQEVCKKVLPEDRVFNQIAPDGVDFSKPMVIFNRVASQFIYYTEGGVPTDKLNSLVRLNVWSPSARERDQIAFALMQGFAQDPKSEPLSDAGSSYDAAMKIYGAMIDISIWASPTA